MLERSKNKAILILAVILISVVVNIAFMTINYLKDAKNDKHFDVVINKFGCKESYEFYTNPSYTRICNKLTGGHCMSTEMLKHNAEMRIAQCLCDKHQIEESEILKWEILNACTNSVHCTRDPPPTISQICVNKNLFLAEITIE